MKKNILGAFVIFFVTIAILLMIDDISNQNNPEINHSAHSQVEGLPSDLAQSELE